MPTDTIDFRTEEGIDFQEESVTPSLQPVTRIGPAPTVSPFSDAILGPKPTPPTTEEALAAVQTPYLQLPKAPSVTDVPPTSIERAVARFSPIQLTPLGRLIDEKTHAAIGREVLNQAVGAVEFFESPMGGAALAGGTLAPTATSAYFTVDLWKNAYAQAKDTIANWGQMTRPEKAQALVRIVTPALMGAGTAGAAAKGARAKVDAALKARQAGMPKTAAAVEQPVAPTALTPQVISGELLPAPEIGPGRSAPPEPVFFKPETKAAEEAAAPGEPGAGAVAPVPTSPPSGTCQTEA